MLNLEYLTFEELDLLSDFFVSINRTYEANIVSDYLSNEVLLASL